MLRACRQHYGVELVDEANSGNVDTDVLIDAEFDALRAHLFDASIDVILLHLEVRYAVAQQATDTVIFLEQNHVVAGARELLCTRHSGRTRADDGDALASPDRGRLRHYPALFPALVDNEVLDRLDTYRIIIDVERARRLARCRTNPTGELRKIVGRVQHIERLPPLMPVNQVVPIGDDVVDRAARLAERDATIHTTRALLCRRLDV